MSRIATAVLVALGTVAGCGYFNSLYNAQRRFDEAERARMRGQTSVAQDGYLEAIDKAASSYRGHPDGRWADDALYLIGRARFMMGEHDAAAAALQRVLERTNDGDMRAGALAYLGAAQLELGNTTAALASLDSATTRAGNGQLGAFARLWRARALYETGRYEEAQADLERAAEAGGPIAAEARLEAAARALMTGDSAALRVALYVLLDERDAARHADSVGSLAAAAASRWGSEYALDVLAVERTEWPNAAADTLLLQRAQLAAAIGRSDEAIRDAEVVGRRAGRGLADSALTMAARLRLGQANALTDLGESRALLLPALGHTPARDLLQRMRTVEVLVGYARERGRPLALFAAAELARDQLQAPGLARELFIAYADLAPEAVWAPKALLAAALLTDGEEADGLVARAYAQADNPYVLAAAGGGGDPDAYTSAEERLGNSIVSLAADASAEARRTDVSVARAVAVIDSVRLAAVVDSLTFRCGTLLDSLGVFGVRADSARAACMRSDSARLATVLTVDSIQLMDTVKLRQDSMRARLRRGGRDTARDTFDIR